MPVYPDIDFSLAPALGNRLIGQFNSLREIAPIFWSGQQHAWIVTGHAEVKAAYLGSLPLSSDRSQLLKLLIPDEQERARIMPNVMRFFPLFLVNQDPPRQTRLRRLMAAAFGRRVVENYRPVARGVITEVLHRHKDRTEVEFVEEIARQITGMNIMRIIGLDDEGLYLPKLKVWSYNINTGGTNPTKEAMRAMDQSFKEMAEAFQPVVEERRARATQDFTSLLVHAGEGEDRMTDDEIISNLVLILVAGHDTTMNTMTLSVDALSRDRDAREFVRANPDQNVNSIMELSRVIAMSTQNFRVAAEDFEWAGHQIKRGQFVNLITAAANRDPQVFTEPEHLDLKRDQKDNLTFGPGVHHCIGHLLAKMQLSEFFVQFLEMFDSWHNLEEQLTFGAPITFRGPIAMKLHLHRRSQVQDQAQ